MPFCRPKGALGPALGIHGAVFPCLVANDNALATGGSATLVWIKGFRVLGFAGFSWCSTCFCCSLPCSSHQVDRKIMEHHGTSMNTRSFCSFRPIKSIKDRRIPAPQGHLKHQAWPSRMGQVQGRQVVYGKKERTHEFWLPGCSGSDQVVSVLFSDLCTSRNVIAFDICSRIHFELI